MPIVGKRAGLQASVDCTLFARCYRRGATSEYRLKISDFAPTGAAYPKISGRRGRPTNYSSQKTKLNDLSYGIKIWTDLSCVLSQSTRLIDRQMEGQTAFSWLNRVACEREGFGRG